MSRSLLCAAALLVTPLSCGRQSFNAVSVDPSLAKLVPPDATVLAGIDLDALKTTPFYARHRRQLENPLLNSLVAQIGFDPRRDLSRILVIWDGKHLVFAANGRFASQSIESRLAANTPHTPYKNHLIFGNTGQAFALLGSETVVGGTIPSVRGALDLFEQHAGAVPRDFAGIFDQLSKADQIWLVSRGSLPFADMPTRSDQVSILSNFAGYVSSTSVGILADSGLDFRARIDCVSAAGSKRVTDGLRAGIGLAQLSQKTSRPPWSAIYRAISVRQDRTSVYVNADLSPQLSDDLLNAALHH